MTHEPKRSKSKKSRSEEVEHTWRRAMENVVQVKTLIQTRGVTYPLQWEEHIILSK